MKDVRPALRTLLLADTTVSNLVGGSRIYPGVLPQGQRSPSLVYNRISGVFPFELDGSGGIVQNLIQIDAIADSSDTASNLANAVHDALNGFRGTVATVEFKGIFQTNERDIFDSAVQLHRVSRDFSTWFVEY
jgi:hypothetical protein